MLKYLYIFIMHKASKKSAAYPVSTPPMTWPLNDAYADRAKHHIKAWKDKGYTWKFGQELEMVPRTRKQFKEFNASHYELDTDDMAVLSPYYKPSLDLQKQMDKKASNSELKLAIEALGHVHKLIDHVKKSPDMDRFAEEAEISKDNILRELREIGENLLSEDEEERDLARINAYLAYLNLLPSDKGGVRDLVHPRFGSRIKGKGWWDAPNVAEFRTYVMENPDELIEKTHATITKIFAAAKKFDVIPDMNIPGAHFNFSLWRDSDGTNVMEKRTDADFELCQSMMTGLYATWLEAPHLVHDIDPSNISHTAPISSLDRRGCAIRQCENRWEWRRSYESNFVHLARDIAVITGGAGYGAFKLESDDAYRDKKDIKFLTYTRPQFTSRNIFQKDSGLRMALDACTLDENNHLKLNFEDITGIVEYILHHEIGLENAKTYKQTLPNSNMQRDLSQHSTVWEMLFASIQVREDGSLNTDHLPEGLQEDFRPYRMTRAFKNFTAQQKRKKLKYFLLAV